MICLAGEGGRSRILELRVGAGGSVNRFGKLAVVFRQVGDRGGGLGLGVVVGGVVSLWIRRRNG